jgi:hypothetical protein
MDEEFGLSIEEHRREVSDKKLLTIFAHKWKGVREEKRKLHDIKQQFVLLR